MNKRRIAFLIVAVVFLVYLALIAPRASYVLRESYRFVRGAIMQHQNEAWLDEAFEIARTAEKEGETEFNTARELLAEADTHVQAAWLGGEMDLDEALSLVDRAEEVDPDNALVNYVRAGALLHSPGQSVWKEKALAEIEAGNRKQRYETYQWRDREAIQQRLTDDQEVPALVAASLVWYGTVGAGDPGLLRMLGRHAAFAADHYLRMGEPEKALRYARLNFGMAEKLYENESADLITVLVGHAIEDVALGVAEQAAMELSDAGSREEIRRRGLGTHLWAAALYTKTRLGGLSAPSIAWGSVAVILATCFAIFCLVYLVVGGLVWLVARGLAAIGVGSAKGSVSAGLVLLLTAAGPLAALLAYSVTLAATSYKSWDLEGMDLSRVAYFLAYPSVSARTALLVAAGAYVLVVAVFTPLVVRHTLWKQLVWGASLISLYNPFSRGEGARACRGVFVTSLLFAGLVLAGLLIISFWPVSLVMERAVSAAAAGDAPILEDLGRPPKALNAESYKTETGKLARQLQSDDADVARMAALGLRRGLAYEKIPELIDALGRQKDEDVIAAIWGALTALSRDVQAKPLKPYVLAAGRHPSWDAAVVLARSETVGARYLMDKLHSALSGETVAWGEDQLDVFLEKLAASIRAKEEPEKMEVFASALAEGGHPDVAMVVVKQVEQTEQGIRGPALRALGYVHNDEAKEAYRRYLTKSEFSYQWDMWPSTLEFLDGDLVAWILREHTASKEPLGYDELQLAEFVSPQMIPLLLEGLDAAQPSWTRAFCVERLGEVGDESVVPALLQVLSEEPPSPPLIPTEPVEADKALADLLELESPDPWAVRVSAARALGEIGSPLARVGLEIALEDPHEEVREAARWALDRLPH